MVVPAIFFVLVRPMDAYIGKFTSAPTETFPVFAGSLVSELVLVVVCHSPVISPSAFSYRTAVITSLAMGPVLFIGIVSLDDFDDHF